MGSGNLIKKPLSMREIITGNARKINADYFGRIGGEFAGFLRNRMAKTRVLGDFGYVMPQVIGVQRITSAEYAQIGKTRGISSFGRLVQLFC